MTMMGHPGRVEGVGVTYHPFLHDYLLERVELFDFIELPLDLYIDPARSALLDPGQARLHQAIAAKPCTWRGSGLALGTVEPGFPRYTLQTVQRLLAMTLDAPYTDVIGFRVPGHGARHAMPFTPAAARWVAQRQAEAQHTLAVPVRLALPHGAWVASGLDALAFLALIDAHGGTGIVLDAALARSDDVPLPAVAALSVSSDDAAAWDRLSLLAARLQPRTIVLCRDRQLFPLDTIERDLRRARSLLATMRSPVAHFPLPLMGEGRDEGGASRMEVEHARQPSRGAATLTLPSPASGRGSDAADRFDANGLAALLDHQRATHPVASGEADDESWRNWRTQVDDMHKAQQIAALLSRGAPGPAWRA